MKLYTPCLNNCCVDIIIFITIITIIFLHSSCMNAERKYDIFSSEDKINEFKRNKIDINEVDSHITDHSKAISLQQAIIKNDNIYMHAIPSWLIADGLGNKDGIISGYEIQLLNKLNEIKVGETCILGLDSDSIDNNEWNLHDSIIDILCMKVPNDLPLVVGIVPHPGELLYFSTFTSAVKLTKYEPNLFYILNHFESVRANFYSELKEIVIKKSAQLFQEAILPKHSLQYPEIKKIVLDRMQSFSNQCQERLRTRLNELDKAIEARLCPVEELYHIAHEIGLDESHCRNGEGCNRLSGEPWRPLVCEEGTELYYQMTLELAAVQTCTNPIDVKEARKGWFFFLTGTPEDQDFEIDVLEYYSQFLKKYYTKETLKNFLYGEYYDDVRAMEIVENSGLMSPEEAMVRYIPLGVYDDVYDRMYYKYMNGETDSLWKGAVVSLIRRCKWDELSKLELTKYLAPERIEWYKRVCDYQKTGL